MKNSLSILTVPAFDDNYLWIIHDGHAAVVVDPGDAVPVEEALQKHHLALSAILITHHHGDHTGGIATLLKMHAVPVYGPAHPAIPSVSHVVSNAQQIHLASPDCLLQVIAVPGHTREHIAYFCPEQEWLFCGDTLFAGGCGRLFDGTPAQMLHSLDTLYNLPDQTLVYCAHEYTLANLRFAAAVEPHNPILQQRGLDEQNKRSRGIPTVPSRLELEKQTNPFLRIRETSVVNALLAQGKIPFPQDDISHFAALREWKNRFA
ncbi:hydroxyacylglutathione hydrolase [Undibacterium griseum]|uniref:Hydroxyacylglutathione hydrolase n=1 Tax=Undibacterium griseum TaxID=2762295 RepID=A0ABR6YRJ9_9BURK|nr:hydroxyacylglutathione hydrolase [Undibacterium griseum]MBC3886378.1 hydroxyacylglutathione hydrolase [Undibacterium griseum]